MPQFDFAIYPGLIFWLFVVFSVLYVAIRWVFLDKIRSGIIHRKSTMDAWLEEAQELRDHAEKLTREDERKLKNARDRSFSHIQSSLVALKTAQREEERAILERLEEKRKEVREEMQRTWQVWHEDIDKLSSDLADVVMERIRSDTSYQGSSTKTTK